MSTGPNDTPEEMVRRVVNDTPLPLVTHWAHKFMCSDCQAKLARGESVICGCVLSTPTIT